MWKILSSLRTADWAQGGVLHQEEEDREEDLWKSQITTQEIHIFAVSITVEDTVRKLAQKPKEHRKKSARKKNDEHCLYAAKPILSKFLATTTHGSSVKLNLDSAIASDAIILEPSHQLYPQSQATQTIQQPQPI
jgi:hypothetical protein